MKELILIGMATSAAGGLGMTVGGTMGVGLGSASMTTAAAGQYGSSLAPSLHGISPQSHVKVCISQFAYQNSNSDYSSFSPTHLLSLEECHQEVLALQASCRQLGQVRYMYIYFTLFGFSHWVKRRPSFISLVASSPASNSDLNIVRTAGTLKIRMRIGRYIHVAS